MYTDEHPAFMLREPQRVDYLTVIASLVLADGILHHAEMQTLRSLCHALELSPAGEQAVVDAVRDVDRKTVQALLEWVRIDQRLRYAMMADAIILVMADGRIAPSEAKEISAMAQVLRVPASQITLISRYVESVIMGAVQQNPAELPLSRTLAEGVAAAGAENLPSAGWVKWMYQVVKAKVR